MLIELTETFASLAESPVLAGGEVGLRLVLVRIALLGFLDGGATRGRSFEDVEWTERMVL